ncbi:MAG TPA: RNA polymerase-binding protein DksA [Steroidobacteraceae bacterium]|nr:RNA polymerase-binding protein DksA [Steroidobacteraceae bacterium]
MPAKKPAPKPAKGKKSVSRPPARKVAARKSPERVKVVSHARPKVATPTRRPAAANGASREAEPVRGTLDATHAHAPASLERAVPPAKVAPPVQRLQPATDAEDTEAVEPGSLLAGPRNVQPYIVKRGEQYMSKEQTEHFRQILLNWKQDLMEEVDRTVTHMKDEAANFPDPNDRATQEEEFSLELRTRDRERKLIRKIDEALKRIEDGTYGYCLETGEEIGIKRLEARPVATLSIEAQERRERRERQYGDRDDRYR